MQLVKNKNILVRKSPSYLLIIVGLLYFSFALSAKASDAPSVILSDQQPGVSSKLSHTLDGENNAPIKDGKNPVAGISTPTILPEEEENIRLLQVTVDHYQFDELIVVYQFEDMLFIPFGAFSSLIDLAINADTNTGIAQGFIFNEKKTFYLDVNRGEVTISGILSKIDNKRTAVRVLDDIYVDSELLTEWLPLKIEIDLYASRLKVKPDRPLPFQLRRERQQRLKSTQARLIPIDRGYPRYSDPYQDWSYPHINFSARAGTYKNNEDKTGSTYSHATYATADLFKMESAWYVAGDQDDFFDDYRVTFGKKDVDAELMGPLKASEYAFGHVIEPRIDLINRPLSVEPGFYISNYPLTRQQQYDSHSFSGDLPPGWEVELYRNNSLINYQPVAVEGRYQFDDVPLLYGHNYFRLVFYGPQGQIREETHTFELGQSLTIPGEQNYRIFMSTDEDFGNRTVMQYDVGINKKLSAAAGFARLPIDKTLLFSEPESYHQYMTAGIRGYHESFYYKLNYTKDTKGGTAADWGIQSRLGPVILKLNDVHFNDFVSEEFGETLIPITQRKSMSLDSAIPLTFISRIPISLEYQQDTYDDNSEITRVINRISAQKHGYAATNNLIFQSVESQDDQLSGTLQVSRRATKYNLRANLGYLLRPDSELESVSLTTDGFKLWGYNTSVGIIKVISEDTTQMILGLNQQLNGYSLGMSARVTTDGVFSFDLVFNTSLVREPRKGQWLKKARSIANQGAISTQVYLDRNSDGKKDPEDDALSGVKININGGAAPVKTNEDGIAFNTGLVTYRAMDVDIALETLEDPLLLPGKKGVRVDLRPGHVTQLDFPVVMTGEVDGTAYVNFGGIEREASGVVVELVDEDGTVLQTTKTAYDGFFVLDKIPVGVFKLRVSEKQIKELDLNPVEPVIIEITAEKQILNGQNFVLTRKE